MAGSSAEQNNLQITRVLSDMKEEERLTKHGPDH